MLSTKKRLACLPLESAMYESLGTRWGVKIKLNKVSPQNINLVKATFYLLKKENPDFENLSLLSTKFPDIYLIYHPEKENEKENEDETLKGNEDGENRLG